MPEQLVGKGLLSRSSGHAINGRGIGEAGQEAMTTKVMVINGPNLNLLGTRQPEIYGQATLADVEKLSAERAAGLGLEADCRQSNHEGEIVDWIQEARSSHAGIVINAGGLSHTSVAIPDALQGVALPVIEIHVSNIYKREAFRHHSRISPAAIGVIAGFGIAGYGLAIEALVAVLEEAG